ncbi:MAG TPA: alkaline phosphatase family protein [Anaerolineales bacterium]|nr:alkaline phosphatase family protein [Anaerolineales bacterium]
MRALDSSAPISTPIKNIIIFTQENHSFDSIFADFPGANSQYAGKDCPDSLSQDPPHRHADAFAPQGATTEEARCSYTEADAPNYWKIARAFTLCDNYFADIRGPSYPNFLMLIAAQSPIIDPPAFETCPDFCLDFEVLPNHLDAAGLTWQDYGGIFTSTRSMVGRSEVMAFRDEKFFEDAERGILPNVAWLSADLLIDGHSKSGHPPSSLCVGENYAVSVLNAVMNSPQWSTTALFLVWDEWGGFYDHIEPPVVERWTDGSPSRYGHRVPCIVISPYARPGYVSHVFASHVSLLRFAETVFDLEPLTERDAHATNMLDCFDFDQEPLQPISLQPRDCPP